MNLINNIFIIILTVTCSLFASQNAPADSTALSKKAWAMFDYAETIGKDTKAAMENYQTALGIGKKIRENYLLEMCYGRLAATDYLNSRYQQALPNLDSAITYCNKNNKRYSYEWKTLKAYVYHKIKKHNLALKILNNVEKEALKNNDLVPLYRCYIELRRIYSEIDLLQLANKTTEKLVQLAGQIKIQRKDGLYRRLADDTRRKKNYSKAINIYKHSLALISYNYGVKNLGEIKAYTFDKIGDCYFELKDYSNAEKNYLKGLLYADSVNSEYYSALSILDLCNLYLTLKNLVSTKVYINKLKRLVSQESDIELKIRKNIVLGRLFYTEDNLDSSLFYFKRSLNLFEKQINNINIERARSGFIDRESGYFVYINNIYKDLIQSDQNKAAYQDSLFKFSNIIRSRTLIEKKNYKDDLKDSLYSESVTDLKKCQRDLRLSAEMTENQEIELNGLRYQLLNNKLYQMTDQIESINQVSLTDFKKYLGQSNSTALIYNLNPYDQYVISVNADNIKIIDLDFDKDSLSIHINKFFKSAFFNKKDNTFNTKTAFRLYRDLFQPIEQTMKLNKNIIIIPDKPILSLPFDILMDKADQKSLYKATEYPAYAKNLLVNKYNFSFLPSANLVKTFRPVHNDEQLIIANPNFSKEIQTDPAIVKKTGWAFEPLLFSKLEAKSVKQSLKDAIILEDDAADFTTVTKHIGKSSIIHFATHAFVDTVFDMFSGLVLSMGEDSSSDGFLMGYDISNLKLNCDLITLSACESGRGRLLNNEGIMGLPRLFFAAGARSTLMSLWKVSDKFSAEFIPRFYKNLVEENMSKTEALGEVKRFIIQKYSNESSVDYYSNPYYWATFNLYGDVTNNISNSGYLSRYLYLILLLLIASVFFIVKKLSKN